ncbi:Anti-sigma-K factor rskA [Geodermatophilus dictyosporus]|uniref:Regulator of SigK n=1 Tax=Geodermatophilus dictyosporus TaxID=1523247 RepID=A0A1I5PW90_9ACTN|nr:anti-sigma factor [Geodermatophilus dictyosporus]SFP38234.1 Anti-sigma-K factor rskA [Geodermatophilus dictyosporus]
MSARPDPHETFDELAVGWALHALEPEDEAVFGTHLPTCPRCARTVAETSEVMSAMAGDLPPAEPSDDLRDRLRAAVERTEQVAPPPGAVGDAVAGNTVAGDVGPAPAAAAPGRPGGRRRTDPPPVATGFPGHVPTAADAERTAWRRVLPNALVAAAVAAVLALGTWVVVLGAARDDAQTLAAERAEVLESVLQPGRAAIAPVVDDDGRAVATVVARDGQLQVVSTGLTVNDRSDSTYVVWGVQGQTPVPLGTFDVVTPQTDLRTVGSASTGLDDFEGYAISIEPGRQMPAEPSDVVASGQVTS